jgi:hypothetical protein
MSSGNLKHHANKASCPVCGSPCTSIRTNQLTADYREIVYRCRNGACGHVFVAALTPIRTVLPSQLAPSSPDRIEV